VHKGRLRFINYRMSPLLPPAVWTCRVHPFLECRNARLSGIQSVRYRNEKKFRCQNQSGTGLRDPVRFRNAPVPEWITGCQNANGGGIDLDADDQRNPIPIYDTNNNVTPLATCHRYQRHKRVNLPPVSTTPAEHLELRTSSKIF
jgi:hypothetical protein